MGVGASVGLLGAVRGLLNLKTEAFQSLEQYLVTSWHVQVDCLSSLFLISIFLLGGLGAVYGTGYFSVGTRGYEAVRLRVYYGVVVAGMALLVVAKHAIIFLVGWEFMALFAFMALTVQDKKEPVRQAGFVYLVATRIGTLALIAMFALLRVQTGSFSLDVFGLGANSGLATATFLLGLMGFGLKAGIIPLHFWLPAAHANAPTHVSALMSGVMIKTGIYGFLRLTSFYGDIPTWWGHLVLILGLTSALLGVAFALGQHDIKRLLAYHSVENIGIILLGVAVGLIGRNKSDPLLIFLGYGGALLHVLNHGLFKALLFFGAGAVISATGTRELERYGALSRRMPFTATAFLIGAIAISGLPPLNGFVSEVYIYLGMFSAQNPALGLSATALAFAIPVLATVGALALACFIKVYAVVFLGKSRNITTETAKEGPWSVRLPEGVLALGCILIGLFAQAPWSILRGAVFCLAGPLPIAMGKNATSIANGLKTLSIVHGCLATIAVTMGLVLWRIPSKSPVRTTWDCGFVGPSARVQYTASSIADDLVAMFATVLRPKVQFGEVRGVFPQSVSFASHIPEVILDLVLLPLLQGITRIVAWLRLMQRGAVHLYLFYVLLTLVVMLAVWR
jgi:hydrogenase-4 component B